MRFFLKHTGFIVLLTLLSVLYIYNTHCAERKLRKIAVLKKSVEDSKSHFQEVKSDINYRCTESQLAKLLENKGLQKNEEAPILLKAEESR